MGPEAALLALCGAAVSFTGKHLLGYKGHTLRNCALLGMTAGLAAFFGVALGGEYVHPKELVLRFSRCQACSCMRSGVRLRSQIEPWLHPYEPGQLPATILNACTLCTGSLFALEVLHRTGMQFFEVATFAVFCGVTCLVVFRGLSQASFGAVWVWTENLQSVDWHHVVLGEALP